MKRPKPDAPADPSQLAVGYMFPDLFQDEALILRSQEYQESPFAPAATAQLAMPGMPAVDWDHIREKAAAERRQRRQKRAQPKPLAVTIRPTDDLERTHQS
jgi:hypothetical protein